MANLFLLCRKVSYYQVPLVQTGVLLMQLHVHGVELVAIKGTEWFPLTCHHRKFQVH
jgi:hypothetical protein